ncbi:hypothetical protein [Sebaldella termitidis]|nr:hypothetical protein [Sebaldella termitidis]
MLNSINAVLIRLVLMYSYTEIMDKNNLSAGILSLLSGGLISLYNYRR